MQRILVTGGSGLIGGSLLARLARQGHEVHALTRSPRPQGSARWISCDLADPAASFGDFPASVDSVVCLAQSDRYRDFPAGAADVFSVNIMAVFRLLEWARQHGVRRFIYASTGGVYGRGVGARNEDDRVSSGADADFYMRSKISGESMVQSYAPFFSAILLRYFFVYGAGQRDSMFIPRLIGNVAAGRPLTLQGGDGMRVNPVYVDDAVNATSACLALERSAIYNVAGRENVSIRELGKLIGECIGVEPAFAEVAGTAGDLIGDFARMSALAGPPQVDLRAGIKYTAASLGLLP